MFFFLGIFQKRFGNGEKGVHSNISVELFQVWISKLMSGLSRSRNKPHAVVDRIQI